jgi:hypothetical protein
MRKRIRELKEDVVQRNNAEGKNRDYLTGVCLEKADRIFEDYLEDVDVVLINTILASTATSIDEMNKALKLAH